MVRTTGNSTGEKLLSIIDDIELIAKYVSTIILLINLRFVLS